MPGKLIEPADLGIAHHGDGFVRIIEPGKRQTFRKQRLHKLPHDRGSYNFQGSRHRQSSFRAQTEKGGRSEEHTSELQSLMRISYAVFCLKKKKKQKTYNNTSYEIHKR